MKNMFFRRSYNGQYLFSDDDIITDINDFDGDLCLPINTDTEYMEIPLEVRLKNSEEIDIDGYKFNISKEAQKTRIRITSQFSDYYNQNQCVICHSEVQKYTDCKDPVSKHGVHFVDYLEFLGYKVSLTRTEKIIRGDFSNITFMCYAHFALAELLTIFEGDYHNDVLNVIRGNTKSKIEQKSRLRTFTPKPFGQLDYIELPWLLNLNGKIYGVNFCIIDTYAVNGKISYKQFCLGNGINVEFKDSMDSYKSKMLVAYIIKNREFRDYALGDLQMSNCLKNYNENLRKIYNDCGIPDRFTPAKLTIGSTVARLFLEKLLSLFPKSISREDFNEFFGCQASILKGYVDHTRSLLSKCDGGRCRNNQPSIVKIKGNLCDIDISGCYGNGMRIQDYPLGKPIIEDFPVSKNNQYLSLGQWLKLRKYGKKNDELVDGLWLLRVSSESNLTYPQDMIPSWVDWKVVKKSKKYSEIDTKTGLSKIFSNQIINGVITSDVADWIFNCCSARQKKELLEKLQVVSAVYYPSYLEFNSIEHLLKARDSHIGKNETVSGNSKINKVESDFYGWYRVNLGDFLVDLLLANRKKYPKKHPLNVLYKLITNTLYGVSVSPFFQISNVVVGNNITARARVCCWALEKSLNGVQSITDGVAFDINKVVFTSRQNCKLNQENVYGLYRSNDVSKRNIRLKPISENGEYININWGENKLKIGENIIDNALEYIADMAMKHCSTSFNLKMFKIPFSKISVENDEMVKTPINGVFSLEVKDFFKEGLFHGSANYCLKSPSQTIIKMRSYETKKHQLIMLKNDSLELSEYPENSPSNYFFKQVDNNSKSVSRGKIFVKQGILKLSDYQNNQARFDNIGKKPGDSIDKIGLLREFSLSQFTFKNIEQYKAIFRESESNKRRYYQTYEGYFIDEYGNLNFEFMVKKLDEIISSGSLTINKELDRHRNRSRYGIEHCHGIHIENIKKNLADIQYVCDLDFSFEFDPYEDNDTYQEIEVIDEIEDDFELDL
jgi:hypothetical protein